MTCNHRYPTNIENSSTQNTRLIIYFIKVSMDLFEVKMFNIVINIKSLLSTYYLNIFNYGQIILKTHLFTRVLKFLLIILL